MHNGRLRQLLAELFAAHGYDVTVDAALEGRSGGFYSAPVLAESGDHAVLVERTGADEHLSADKVRQLADVVEDIGAEQGLIVHLGTIDADARTAGAGRIILWDADRLARLIGSVRIHEATGLPPERLPLEADVPAVEVPTPDASFDFLPEAFAAPTPEPEPSLEFGAFTQAVTEPEPDVPVFDGIDLDALDALPAPTPEPSPEPLAPSVPSFMAPSDAPTTAHPVLSPRLTAEDAAARVRDRLYLVESSRLVLQPVHLMDYECDLLVEGSLRYDTVAGRLQVHGTNKQVGEVDATTMDPGMAGAAPDVPNRERTLRVTHERAHELAREAITAAHTRLVEIETTDEVDDVCYTERKQVAPRPDHVRIQHLGVVHRPQWELRGPNGALLVDALTGEAVAEELRSADPGVIMLD